MNERRDECGKAPGRPKKTEQGAEGEAKRKDSRVWGKEPRIRKNRGMTGGFYQETRHLQMLEMKATAGVLANGPRAPVGAVPCIDQRMVPDRMPPVMESRPLRDGKHLH